MMSLLISDPKQPGNDINVYLTPLIEDLKELWHFGIEDVYDAYGKEIFTCRAAVLWTVNDYPAYENLSGHRVKEKKVCPTCGSLLGTSTASSGCQRKFVKNITVRLARKSLPAIWTFWSRQIRFTSTNLPKGVLTSIARPLGEVDQPRLLT